MDETVGVHTGPHAVCAYRNVVAWSDVDCWCLHLLGVYQLDGACHCPGSNISVPSRTDTAVRGDYKGLSLTGGYM